MSLKITGSTRLNDPAIIAKQMADNTALQYQLGYEDLQRQLMGDDPDYTPSPTVSIIDPTKTIRLPRQKLQKGVLSNSQGYNAKQMTQSNVPVLKSNPNAEKAKEFITQTRALDNDLDHALSLMKLNNKDEFYGGSLFTQKEKDHYQHNASDSELEELYLKLMTQFQDKYENGEDYEDEYENIKFLEKIMLMDSIDPASLIRNLGKYKELDNAHDKELVESVLLRNAKGKKNKVDKDTVNALKELGYDINRKRNEASGKHDKLNNIDDQTVFDTYTGLDSDRRSKKGVRVVNEIGVEKLSSDLLLLTKKIANGINILIPLAQTLVDTRYQGISHADKLMLQEMYQDMDEKLYILTSLNNVDNTAFVKMDKNFDKLYETVKRGLDNYNGGAMKVASTGPGIYVPPAHTYVKVYNRNYL